MGAGGHPQRLSWLRMRPGGRSTGGGGGAGGGGGGGGGGGQGVAEPREAKRGAQVGDVMGGGADAKCWVRCGCGVGACHWVVWVLVLVHSYGGTWVLRLYHMLAHRHLAIQTISVSDHSRPFPSQHWGGGRRGGGAPLSPGR